MDDILSNFSFGDGPEGEEKDFLQERYEQLILKREGYERDASNYEVEYLKEFGTLTADIFKEKIDCIRLKKTIAACQASINAGKPVDIDAMKKKIGEEMLLYETELKTMLKKNKDAEEAKTIPLYKAKLAKQIYRRIVKVLHPDINAKTEENMELTDLWNRVREAYGKGDADALEDLEILVNHKLQELGDEGFEVNIQNITEKIKRVEKQITVIITTRPYIYGELLEDPEAVKKKKDEMNRELEEFKKYKAQLEEYLEDLLSKGGMKFTWQMN